MCQNGNEWSLLNTDLMELDFDSNKFPFTGS